MDEAAKLDVLFEVYGRLDMTVVRGGTATLACYLTHDAELPFGVYNGKKLRACVEEAYDTLVRNSKLAQDARRSP
jgi:hypothetical protein